MAERKKRSSIQTNKPNKKPMKKKPFQLNHLPGLSEDLKTMRKLRFVVNDPYATDYSSSEEEERSQRRKRYVCEIDLPFAQAATQAESESSYCQESNNNGVTTVSASQCAWSQACAATAAAATSRRHPCWALLSCETELSTASAGGLCRQAILQFQQGACSACTYRGWCTLKHLCTALHVLCIEGSRWEQHTAHTLYNAEHTGFINLTARYYCRNWSYPRFRFIAMHEWHLSSSQTGCVPTTQTLTHSLGPYALAAFRQTSWGWLSEYIRALQPSCWVSLLSPSTNRQQSAKAVC